MYHMVFLVKPGISVCVHVCHGKEKRKYKETPQVIARTEAGKTTEVASITSM